MGQRRGFLSGRVALEWFVCLAAGCGGGGSENLPDPYILPMGDPNASSPPIPKLRCSSDLRQILSDDAAPRVLQECPPDQGCALGRCVPACEAASAAQGSLGCDFYTLPPDDDKTLLKASCFAAYVANTWAEPLTISAEYDGRTLDIGGATFVSSPTLTPLAGALPPGQVAIIFLSAAPVSLQQCPRPAALGSHPIENGTGITRAIRITTSRPVSAYSIFPYNQNGGEIASATLLLPVSSWSANNILVSGWGLSSVLRTGDDLPPLPVYPFAQVVAAQDTVVTITPKVSVVPGRDVEGASARQPHAWSLRTGEVLQINQASELTGSFLTADHPVAVFGGNQCLDLPEFQNACDILHQQIPPPISWGSEYALVPPPSRTLSPELTYYRIVGAADGTILQYDATGAVPFDAPLSLGAGEFYTFQSRAPLVVRSQDRQHPFYASTYMTGQDSVLQSAYNPVGDPEFLNLVPADQYLDRYVFFMDPSYRVSSLTVVRKRGANGFAAVELDCLGEIPGFSTVDPSETTQVAYVDMSGLGGQACGPGRHEVHSDQPFAVYVWGLGWFSSYAYAGGQGLRPLFDALVNIPR